MVTQKAVVVQGDGTAKVVTDRPIPSLRPGYLRVAPKAVALNPTDWKTIAGLKKSGHQSGCDFAGVVEELGEGYDKQWKVGDRIAGLASGGNRLQPEDGAFAEHIIAKADVAIRVPDNMTFEQAAPLGVGVFTCAQGLYQTLGLNWPDKPSDGKEAVLIFAGSTATGALGVQYAKLSGYKVISTCSPANFDYVKSLGADAVVDYKDPECAKKIIEAAGGKLQRVWDTISLSSSAKICGDVLAAGGHYAAILPTKVDTKNAKNSFTMAYTVLGEPVDRGFFKQEDCREDFEYARKFAALTEKLLAEGKLRTHKQKVSKAGLDGVLEGLDLMKNNKVSGEKLVYVL